MFPSSDVQIIERTANRLVILDPPYYPILIVFGLACLFWIGVASLGGFAGMKGMTRFWLAIGAIAFAIPAAFVSSSATVTLDRRDNVITKMPGRHSLARGYWRMPLSELDRVVVEAAGPGTHNLRFIWKSGKDWTLGGNIQRGGYYQAADAINEFIGAKR